MIQARRTEVELPLSLSVTAASGPIVGATAVELGDYIPVPLHKVLPGSIMQALAYESVIQGRMLVRPAHWTVLSIAFLLALLLGPWFAALSWRRGLIVLASCALASAQSRVVAVAA